MPGPGDLEGADGPDEALRRQELARAQLALYIETLQATMDPPQYELLMDVIRMYVEAGGGRIRIRIDGEERELFTREVQKELLTLIGLLGALEPGHEDRGDLVVAELGDGEHIKGAMSLVPVAKAENPEELLRMREQLDTAAGRRRADTAELEAIARVSGMLPEPESAGPRDSGQDAPARGAAEAAGPGEADGTTGASGPGEAGGTTGAG